MGFYFVHKYQKILFWLKRLLCFRIYFFPYSFYINCIKFLTAAHTKSLSWILQFTENLNVQEENLLQNPSIFSFYVLKKSLIPNLLFTSFWHYFQVKMMLCPEIYRIRLLFWIECFLYIGSFIMIIVLVKSWFCIICFNVFFCSKLIILTQSRSLD